MRAEVKIREGLAELLEELKLLRNLESADRRADKTNCPKSLAQQSALGMLDDMRLARGVPWKESRAAKFNALIKDTKTRRKR